MRILIGSDALCTGYDLAGPKELDGQDADGEALLDIR